VYPARAASASDGRETIGDHPATARPDPQKAAQSPHYRSAQGAPDRRARCDRICQVFTKTCLLVRPLQGPGPGALRRDRLRTVACAAVVCALVRETRDCQRRALLPALSAAPCRAHESLGRRDGRFDQIRSGTPICNFTGECDRPEDLRGNPGLTHPRETTPGNHPRKPPPETTPGNHPRRPPPATAHGRPAAAAETGSGKRPKPQAPEGLPQSPDATGSDMSSFRENLSDRTSASGPEALRPDAPRGRSGGAWFGMLGFTRAGRHAGPHWLCDVARESPGIRHDQRGCSCRRGSTGWCVRERATALRSIRFTPQQPLPATTPGDHPRRPPPATAPGDRPWQPAAAAETGSGKRPKPQAPEGLPQSPDATGSDMSSFHDNLSNQSSASGSGSGALSRVDCGQSPALWFGRIAIASGGRSSGRRRLSDVTCATRLTSGTGSVVAPVVAPAPGGERECVQSPGSGGRRALDLRHPAE